MEHNSNIPPRTSIDERACPSTPAPGDPPAQPPDDPQFASQAEADAWWAGVTHGLRCAAGEIRREEDGPPAPDGPRDEAAEILDPSGRRLRVDGWLPWKKAQFLLVLAAGGIVADACAAAGMSVASAYALKNRRSGRAFGKMWEAILIHRARGRLADNNLSRAMEGCVEQVLKDGSSSPSGGGSTTACRWRCSPASTGSPRARKTRKRSCSAPCPRISTIIWTSSRPAEIGRAHV